MTPPLPGRRGLAAATPSASSRPWRRIFERLGFAPTPYGRAPLETRNRSDLDLHRNLMQRAGINPE